MVIGLMGFEFESANKGCEALSYSFLSVLLEVYSSKNITIYNFSNQGMGEIPRMYPDVNIEHMPLKIKDISFKMVRAMAKCDCIYDVTMGDSFSDIYSEAVCLSDMRFKLLAQFFSRRYVLLPQTYGPYYSPKVKKWATIILKNASEIYCRDEMSQQYIKDECGITNAILLTDLAFLLPFHKEIFCVNNNKFNLGINISGLLWQGGFTKDNQFGLLMDYQKYVLEVLTFFAQKANIQIHLIPHVIDLSSDAHDDDYKVCTYLKQLFPDAIIAPVFKTPIEAKSYIANMDCFIGARMHSTVAAISTGVATIPVSYSRKFEGLYESMEFPYLIKGKEMSTERAYDLTLEYVEQVENIRAYGEQSMDLIKEKLNKLISAIERHRDESN